MLCEDYEVYGWYQRTSTSITYTLLNVHSLLSNHELCTYNLKFYVAKERNKIKREQIKEKY